MMELWPFTNFHDLNLDWIIKTIKVYTKKVDDFIADITQAWNDFKDWTTGQIDQMHDDFANYVNVTEGALNTGAIADGAITKPKIDNDFLKEIENYYVTPEMFGAAGDNITDDAVALQNAVNDGRPVLLLNKYKSTVNIEVPEYTKIFGNDIYNTGITFENGKGVVITGRWVNFDNFTIEGSQSGTGITFDVNTDAHNITLKNLLINNFETGILYNVTNWNCVTESVRINYCDIGLKTTATGFNMTFINLYTNSCNKCFDLYGTRATFTGCNFGISKPRALELGTNARLVFMECNFECDEKVDVENGEHAIFRLSGYSAIFTNCKFVNIRGTSTITFFATFQSLALAEFHGCRYEAHETNEMAYFFDRTWASTLGYAAIRFTGGCESMPRPDYHSAQEPNWIDVEKNQPMSIYNTSALNAAKMYPGMTFYIRSTKKYAFWDGTNLISMTDGSTIM